MTTVAEAASAHFDLPRHTEHQRLAEIAAAFRDHSGVVRSIGRRVGGAANAGDVTQEVFLRLWAHPERFDPARGSLRNYLCTMARGVAIDLVRQDSARRRRDDLSYRRDRTVLADPEHEAVRSLEAVRVRSALEKLSSAERLAIAHAFGRDLSYRSTAEALGLPAGTVKSQIRIGLKKLRADVSASEIGRDGRRPVE